MSNSESKKRLRKIDLNRERSDGNKDMSLQQVYRDIHYIEIKL